VVHGAKRVVSVDCNPAQSALLELKKLAIEHLDIEDVWQLFGEGRHPNFPRLFLTQLGPFMTEKSYCFWQSRCALPRYVCILP
jgi:betaine lipid synthase